MMDLPPVLHLCAGAPRIGAVASEQRRTLQATVCKASSETIVRSARWRKRGRNALTRQGSMPSITDENEGNASGPQNPLQRRF
ncbi:MAG: hypothetical protein D6795_12180 [Deltaproteobacteria bacterium]|nr:MAG: hypothetical protein D6795_12180 [Deltaproteobacteria bacterium]